MTSETRKVTLQDRYGLACRNAGFPLAITFLTSFPTHSAPSAQRLCDRIAELQLAYPLLRSIVKDGNTIKPYFELREPWKSEEIYRERHCEEDREWIMKTEWDGLGSGEYVPEWSVTRYRGAETTHIALTISHIITDGHGAQRLNELLYNDHPLIPEKLSAIPDMNGHINTKPSFFLLVKLVLLLLVIPKLPTILRRLIQPHDPWLGAHGGRVVKPPTECEGGVRITVISSEVIEKLKLVGKAKGLPTLHSSLYVAYLTAIWSVYGNASTVLFKAQMPMTERTSHPTFSYCTGNYVAAVIDDVLIDNDRDFFSAGRRMQEFYSSAAGIKESRESMGLTRLLPNKQIVPAKPNRPTSWEDTFLSTSQEARPYRFSTSFSNLAKTNLPLNATGLCWSLPSHPFQPPLTIDLIGHEGGAELVTTWMEGAGMDEEGVEKVLESFERIVERLSRSSGRISFGDLL